MGYWPFTGNANDYSGNNNNGLVNGATLTTDRFGNSNRAYSFNGVNNQINVPSTPSISEFPNGQSISFWMKIMDYPNDNKEHYMIDKSDNYSSPNVKFYQACISDYGNVDSVIYRYAASGASSSQGSFIPISSLPLNEWIHLCFTTDLTNTKTYLNGNLISTYSNYSPIGITANPLIFGNRTGISSDNSPFMGDLDDFRIYNRPIDSAEVSLLFEETTCTQYITVTDTNFVTLIDTNYVTVLDTTFLTVTDTLVINTLITGITPPNNYNTIKVYPNPANNHITIEYGDFETMNGYQLRIENSLGQEVFQTSITQQSDYLNLNSWGGNGLYFVHIVDPQGNTIDIRKIVLQ
jgi:hypothetical protein